MVAVIFSPWTFIYYPNKAQDTNCLTGMTLPATHSTNHVHLDMNVQYHVVDGLAYMVCMNYTVIEFQVCMCWNVPKFFVFRPFPNDWPGHTEGTVKINLRMWKKIKLLNNWVVWKPQVELAPPLSAIWTNTSICSCGDAALALLHLNSLAKKVL